MLRIAALACVLLCAALAPVAEAAGPATTKRILRKEMAKAGPHSGAHVVDLTTGRAIYSEDAAVRSALGLEASSYEGPTGIVGVLQHEAAARGMQSLSLWAAVPHYVAHPPSPKASLAILHRVEQLLGETIPLGELPDDAAAWQAGVDELAGEDSEIGDYVRQLEQAKDTAELPEASGEAIAREFERYLKRRGDADGG